MIRQICIFLILPLIVFQCSTKKEKEASKLFLPDNLEATLWAESPMFYNPTNMDVDIKGRIWITEAVNYRNYNNDSTRVKHYAEGDRVVILEDTDQDGKADKSTVFVQDKDLVSPLGIAVIGNRAFVSCSPNLIVYTDDNGDDKADRKEIILSGFGGKDHDHSLHSVTAGPDGKLYFNVGNAGPHIVTDKSGWTLRSGSIYSGGSPYNKANQGNLKSDDGKIWVGGLAMRMNVDGTGLEVIGHNFRNSYEVVIDSYGNLWQNDNDDQVVTCRTTWLMEGGNAGYFSADGTRYWNADQRPWQDIFSAHWHQDDPGVMPAGDKTGAGSPTGVLLYEGDALGDEYRGMLLSADAGRNVIFGYHPKPFRSGFLLADRSNFITSIQEDNKGYVWNDSAQNADRNKWFRPSDIAAGTDGALYIADWYDPVVGGHQMHDSLGYGRIYRIVPKGKRLIRPVFDFTKDTDLVEALKNPAVNVRYQAFAEIAKRDAHGIPLTKELLSSSNPFHQARAIWLLSKLGNEGVNETRTLLKDSNTFIRATAFRALRQVEKDIIPIAAAMANDTAAFVRREVCIAVRDLPIEKTRPIIESLIKNYKADDTWYAATLAEVIKNDADEAYRLLKKYHNPENVTPEHWTKEFASLLWHLHPEPSLNDWKMRVTSPNLSVEEKGKALTALASINTKEAALTMIDLAKSKSKDVKEQASYWVSFRQSNDWVTLVNWEKTGINLEQERKLTEMKVRQQKLLDEYVSRQEKVYDIKAMAKDPVGGQMLLNLIKDKKISDDLVKIVEEHIFQNTDLGVRVQASNYFRSGDNNLSVAEIVSLKRDAKKGSVVFEKNCATCHRVNDTGSDIGPELTLIRKKFDQQALLDAIIHPSAGIVFGYEAWLIDTKEGKSVFGFLIADGAETVVVKDLAGNKHVLKTSSIVSRKKQEKSLMPEPASMGLTTQNLADVTGYLLSIN